MYIEQSRKYKHCLSIAVSLTRGELILCCGPIGAEYFSGRGGEGGGSHVQGLVLCQFGGWSGGGGTDKQLKSTHSWESQEHMPT